MLGCVIRGVRGFLLLNIKIENSNSSVIKLWVIMKGFSLMPGRSPLIAAAVQCCKTPKEPRNEPLTHMYRCYLRWLTYQTCVFVLTHFVSMFCWHPAALQREMCLFVMTETFGLNFGWSLQMFSIIESTDFNCFKGSFSQLVL